jgi:hypothetical protein
MPDLQCTQEVADGAGREHDPRNSSGKACEALPDRRISVGQPAQHAPQHETG